MNAFLHILRRDLRLAFGRGNNAMVVLLFFIVTVTLFPLGIGPEAEILARIAGGTVWVAALLAAMLSLDMLFQSDLEDGSLEMLALSPSPLSLTVLAKCLAHWLATGLPVTIAAPLLAMLMQLPAEGYVTLVAAMALGTPSLSLIGAVGAALTVGVRRGGVLLSLLVLPLYIPILIFGVGAVEAATVGIGASPHLLILGAMLLASLALTPWAAAAALRVALE